MAVRHSYTFSDRHEKILRRLSAKMGVSLVGTLERALESLEVAEAQRDQIVERKPSHD